MLDDTPDFPTSFQTASQILRQDQSFESSLIATPPNTAEALSGKKRHASATPSPRNREASDSSTSSPNLSLWKLRRTTGSRPRPAKFYAVRFGRVPGVYETWDEAEPQVVGFPDALFQHFSTREEAVAYVDPTPITTPVVWQANNRGADLPAPEVNGAVDLDVPLPGLNRPPIKMQEPSLARPADPPLSPQQRKVFDRIISGENFFFTGPAGTGKSVLLRAIIREFRQRERPPPLPDSVTDTARLGVPLDPLWMIGVTASTGLAALNIGGCTLHSWAGIGLGKLPKEKLLAIIQKSNMLKTRWQKTRALIIDEISMIDGHLFDKLEWIGRRVRGCSKPFGGLQIILSGDFFQLPPVPDRDGPKPIFCFESDCWSGVIPLGNMLSLTRVFRQCDDHFIRILEGMRKGCIAASDVPLLRQCDRPVQYPDGCEATALYATKDEVDTVNNRRLSALTTVGEEYHAIDKGGKDYRGYIVSDDTATKRLNASSLWPMFLHVKVGALVMLVTNLNNGFLVNGSTGKIIDFRTIAEAENEGVHVAMPLQGPAPARDKLFPIIEFVPGKYAQSPTPKKVLIPPMLLEMKNAENGMEASRQQIPLILAWALTIHKAQGQTLERVKIDVQKSFTQGQTYVAISRAVALDTMELHHFHASKVMAHEKVLKWADRFEQQQVNDEDRQEFVGSAEAPIEIF